MASTRKYATKIYDIKAHKEKVTCLDLGETGRVLVTGGRDKMINLWAIGEQICFMTLTGHNGSLECVKFAYNDNYVYSADDIGIIRRWDLNAQSICSTFGGHMKSIRTLDFNPSGEYIVSGSNDTTVRLWDIRNKNNCMKTYREHIGHVNSVKFSPDGLWIASAGAEGSIIIWDIRTSKPITQFSERNSSVNTIQFHPYEFLLAAGRNDGAVHMYDLEKNQLISKVDGTSKLTGHPINCITFSEKGDCLFAGSGAGISVIGWEPDRNFDHVEPSWTTLGDMKIISNRLSCGSFDEDSVFIHALNTERVKPIYNPSNLPAFSYNQSTRKSFTRGSQKLRLSINSHSQQPKVLEENEDNSPGLDEQLSPNLSIELVDDEEPSSISILDDTNEFSYNHMNVGMSQHEKEEQPPPQLQTYPFTSLNANANLRYGANDGPNSLNIPGEKVLNRYSPYEIDEREAYNLNDSNPPILNNYENDEVEDFPVNSAQPPDYATVKPLGKPKGTSQIQRKISAQQQLSRAPSAFGNNRKLSHFTSQSTMELHKMDENMSSKRPNPIVTSSSSSRIKRPDSNITNGKDANASKRRDITVQIITKAPVRSKTSIDLSRQTSSEAPRVPPLGYGSQFTSTRITNHIDNECTELQILKNHHERIYQELCNRQTALELIRNSTRARDIVGALRQAQLNGKPVFVDLLGAILEKTVTWNLDMCLLILPEIYELLQSEHKFYYNRACDTLRIIIKSFLPTIRDNVSGWGPVSSIGVDITAEERHRKCELCQEWLLKIRLLPDDKHDGSTLTNIQNLITGI